MAGIRTPALGRGFVHSAFVSSDAHQRTNAIEIDIGAKQACAMTKGHGRNHAVDHPSRSYPGGPAGERDASRRIEVNRCIESQKRAPLQQSPELAFALSASSAYDHFHDHGFSHCNLALVRNEFGEALIDRTPGRPVVLHPSGGIDEDHCATPGPTSSGISPIAWAPRIARASSRVIG